MRFRAISRLRETVWPLWLLEDTSDKQMEHCAWVDHVLYNCWVLKAIWGSADVTTRSADESQSLRCGPVGHQGSSPGNTKKDTYDRINILRPLGHEFKPFHVR